MIPSCTPLPASAGLSGVGNLDESGPAEASPHAIPHFGSFRTGDALLMIDLQNDFLPSGALPVSHGEEVVPVFNRYIAVFEREKLPVFATRDWHPEDHASFREQGGPWPSHCVMHSKGAEFVAGLELPRNVVIISKGSDRADQSYSNFAGTDLAEKLRAAGVERLFVGGLATDYCVLHTVRDARRLGFGVFLLRDAIRAVNVDPSDGTEAEAEMCRLGAVPLEFAELAPSTAESGELLTDLYQLTMLRGYFASRMEDVAVFEFFVRRLPPEWNFFVAAGLEQVLDWLENFQFALTDLEWLQRTGEFDAATVRKLAGLRFTGDVHAMPEGTIFFPDEPVIRVTAPLPQAQVIETRLVNLLHFQTLVASKAVRCVLAARGKQVVDFGLRRAHGAEAGLLAARACFIGGFASSSNVLAHRRFGLPWSGTMAHSFIEACTTEQEAFLRFARANPQQVVLLLDTYDTEAAATKVVELAPVLRREGLMIKSVRLDSGDLAAHAQRVRQILDQGGLTSVTIIASGNLDERSLQLLSGSDVPIDGFGVGSRVVTGGDTPYLDCAYKLQAYAGEPRCKHSSGKATWPGAKQVYREYGADGLMESDTIALASENWERDGLLRCVMRHGTRTENAPRLEAVREHVKQQLNLLPMGRGRTTENGIIPVYKSPSLRKLAANLGVFRHQGSAGPFADPTTHHGFGLWHHIYADRPAGEVLEGAEADGLVRE